MAARLLELVWLMLPAYCANMAPPFAKFWRGWNRPIHRHLLGDHKTIVGFTLGVAVAVGAAFLQSRLSPTLPLLWSRDAWLAVGLALGDRRAWRRRHQEPFQAAHRHCTGRIVDSRRPGRFCGGRAHRTCVLRDTPR